MNFREFLIRISVLILFESANVYAQPYFNIFTPFVNIKQGFSRFEERLIKRFTIFPGTNWCGAGNRSLDNNSLGFLKGVDSCCRDHDRCPVFLSAYETKFGLNNTKAYTRSHCSCDEKFYRCLKKQKDSTSRKIGYTYFNILGSPCFRKDFEIIGCEKNNRQRCLEYSFGNNQTEKIWQWFDVPFF